MNCCLAVPVAECKQPDTGNSVCIKKIEVKRFGCKPVSICTVCQIPGTLNLLQSLFLAGYLKLGAIAC